MSGTKRKNLHAIRDYAEAKRDWVHFTPPDLFQKFFSLLFNDWVRWNLLSDRLHKLTHEWKVKFAVICCGFGGGETMLFSVIYE